MQQPMLAWIIPASVPGLKPEHPIVIPPPGEGGAGEDLHPAHPIVLPGDPSWDPNPPHPAHPIVIPPSGLHPAHPIVIPPPQVPVDPDAPHPEHPIVKPGDPGFGPPVHVSHPIIPEAPAGKMWVYAVLPSGDGWVLVDVPTGTPPPVTTPAPPGKQWFVVYVPDNGWAWVLVPYPLPPVQGGSKGPLRK